MYSKIPMMIAGVKNLSMLHAFVNTWSKKKDGIQFRQKID